MTILYALLRTDARDKEINREAERKRERKIQTDADRPVQENILKDSVSMDHVDSGHSEKWLDILKVYFDGWTMRFECGL